MEIALGFGVPSQTKISFFIARLTMEHSPSFH
jgi:hypothetical protein